jgi:molybdopterin-containing oxidoreductase family membrane subunit
MQAKYGLLAIFMYVDDLFAVLTTLQARAAHIEAVYSPFRLREIEEILQKKPSIVRLLTLLGGILGGTGLVALAVYAHMSYRLITSGKPIFPAIPWVIVLFEGIILVSVVFSVCGWILKGRLPRLHLSANYDTRFSGDRFGVLITCMDTEREEMKKFLEEAGAEEVRDVRW